MLRELVLYLPWRERRQWPPEAGSPKDPRATSWVQSPRSAAARKPPAAGQRARQISPCCQPTTPPVPSMCVAVTHPSCPPKRSAGPYGRCHHHHGCQSRRGRTARWKPVIPKPATGRNGWARRQVIRHRCYTRRQRERCACGPWTGGSIAPGTTDLSCWRRSSRPDELLLRPPSWTSISIHSRTQLDNRAVGTAVGVWPIADSLVLGREA